MSSDDYYYVSRLEGGGFAVTNRSASEYYSDEGWTEEHPPGYVPYGGDAFHPEPHPEWIVAPPKPISTHDTYEEALVAAHAQGYSEYGVCVQEDL